MKTLVIEKKALKNNISVVREKAGPAAIYGVLTGDGCGAGTVELARILREEGVRRFAVAEVRDARALRKAGLVDEEILMLRPICDREALNELLDLGVVCTVSSMETGLALNSVAEARSTIAEAHIQIDAGLGFGGFLASEPDKIINIFRSMSSVAISGVYTQIDASRTSGSAASGQLDVFRQALSAVHAAGFETGVVHAAGSYALMHYEFARMDAVRAGSVLMGRCRRRRGDGLVRVGYGEAAITETLWLPAGHSVGGGQKVPKNRSLRVAVLPVGYQNGFGVSRARGTGLLTALRRWWNGRHVTVRINGQRARVLGRIGAIQTLVDVTELKCSPGDLAYFDIDPLFARGMEREYR